MNIEYNDAFNRSADKPPFANSTEGMAWTENWCARCVHDGYGLGKDEPQCPLLTLSFTGRTPAEWIEERGEDGAWRLDDQYRCVMFRDRDDPGGREPEPVPDPPGQLTLLPREPYTGVRMYVDTRPSAVNA